MRYDVNKGGRNSYEVLQLGVQPCPRCHQRLRGVAAGGNGPARRAEAADEEVLSGPRPAKRLEVAAGQTSVSNQAGDVPALANLLGYQPDE